MLTDMRNPTYADLGSGCFEWSTSMQGRSTRPCARTCLHCDFWVCPACIQ